MSKDRPASGTGERTPASSAFNWRPLAWISLGVALVLLVASFAGNGTGMFGWGWMMGMMWLWMILPLFLLVWFIVYLTSRDRSSGGGAP